MAVIVSDIVEIMNIIAPPWMACKGDRVGLHAGAHAAKVRKLLVALDATLAVIEEAKTRGCQMVVAHHPRFHSPLDTLDEATPMGRLAGEIARARLAVFCAHTNLDIAPGGVNDSLATLTGLEAWEVIMPTAPERLLKLAAFVPESHLHQVREAVCDAGAGVIGDYTECTYRVHGTGAFRGSDETTPFLGAAGQYEEAEEYRLETVLGESVKTAVVEALRAAHPYEEPAYDLYVLDQARTHGLGRIGMLPKAVKLSTLARRLKKAIGSPGVQILGDPKRGVRRVATWGGAACPVVSVADLGAEVAVTGELPYHELEILQQNHVAAILLGHGPSEAVVLEPLAENLRSALPDLDVVCSAAPLVQPRSI